MANICLHHNFCHGFCQQAAHIYCGWNIQFVTHPFLRRAYKAYIDPKFRYNDKP